MCPFLVSVVMCQLSCVSCHGSVVLYISFIVSVVSFHESVVMYQLSWVSCNVSVVMFQLLCLRCNLLIYIFQLSCVMALSQLIHWTHDILTKCGQFRFWKNLLSAFPFLYECCLVYCWHQEALLFLPPPDGLCPSVPLTDLL